MTYTVRPGAERVKNLHSRPVGCKKDITHDYKYKEHQIII